MHDQGAHQAGIAKAHLGLGRMHVDVDLARRKRDEQRDQRVAVARQIIGIGGAHRAEQKLVAHRPAVDEQILAERIGARERRQRGKALDRDALAFGRDLDGVGAEVGAEHVAEPREAPGGAGQRRPAKVTGARSSPASVKATSGRLMASRRTTSRIASASVRSSLRNFSRAGVA